MLHSDELVDVSASEMDEGGVWLAELDALILMKWLDSELKERLLSTSYTGMSLMSMAEFLIFERVQRNTVQEY